MRPDSLGLHERLAIVAGILMDVARDPTLQAAGALPLERTDGAVAALGDVLDRGVVMVSRVERKKIETLFGEAKHILSLVRLRLRGLSGARTSSCSPPSSRISNAWQGTPRGRCHSP
jgi:hypothetical protein